MALAGLAITFPLMNLSAAFGTLVGVGASTLLSIRLGQKDYETANTILGNVVTLNILVGVVFTITALLFLDPILIFFGASPNTLPHAHNFMIIIMGGNVVTHLYFGLNALLRSSGHPKKAMMATIFSVLINIVLNPFFIFVLKLGIRGSALATVISQIVVLCWQIHIFNDKDLFIHWKKGIYKIRAKIFKDSFAIGLAPFLMNAASCLIVILINRQLTKYGGDIAVSAYGIVNRVGFLFVMIVIGINQGMQPIAGYNYGAKLQSRVVEVLKKSIFFATIVMVVGTVVIQLFPHTVASIFSYEQELIDVAASGLRWVFFCYPLVGFQMVSSAFFQSIGKPNKAIILSITRQVLFLVPLLLILPISLHVTGVWISMTISDFISVILTAILLFSEFRNKHYVK
jgi:putative MATE family efflux protein